MSLPPHICLQLEYMLQQQSIVQQAQIEARRQSILQQKNNLQTALQMKLTEQRANVLSAKAKGVSLAEQREEACERRPPGAPYGRPALWLPAFLPALAPHHRCPPPSLLLALDLRIPLGRRRVRQRRLSLRRPWERSTLRRRRQRRHWEGEQTGALGSTPSNPGAPGSPGVLELT
jgi:hypothetical protein